MKWVAAAFAAVAIGWIAGALALLGILAIWEGRDLHVPWNEVE